ncbi:disease resistance TIR-NBS-LRR class family protein, partial [Tanacetum coccineum]
SCGFHARNGLKVLEQRSLITISTNGRLGMHDHIEEMGKNIVRRSHPDEPNKHSRLWKYEEIEDILANDMGTEATRCLSLVMLGRNSRIVMKGLGKMKKLRYLYVGFANLTKGLGSDPKFDDNCQFDIPNSLKYLKFDYYPFLYLPKTFQANNLVGLEMEHSRRMVQLWEEGEKKVFEKLKFLFLTWSESTTFDFRITPNLEKLSLMHALNLKELFMPVCCRKLKYLHINESDLITFDFGLTPNLETLSLGDTYILKELCMPASCQKLKYLRIDNSDIITFNLGLTPNLETLSLPNSFRFVKLKVPVVKLKDGGNVVDAGRTANGGDAGRRRTVAMQVDGKRWR